MTEAVPSWRQVLILLLITESTAGMLCQFWVLHINRDAGKVERVCQRGKKNDSGDLQRAAEESGLLLPTVQMINNKSPRPHIVVWVDTRKEIRVPQALGCVTLGQWGFPITGECG